MVVDITPKIACKLSGYKYRASAYSGIADRLEANIIKLGNKSSLILLVSLDTFLIDDEFKARILLGVNESSEIPLRTDQLLIAASHTHFAPSLWHKSTIMNFPDLRYIDEIVAKITESILSVISAEGIADTLDYKRRSYARKLAVNRRRLVLHRWKRIIPIGLSVHLAPSYSKDSPNFFHLIELKKKTKIVGLIWSYACHPTESPDFETVSANYIGAVRSSLRRKYGELPVCFFNGFAGNINPKTSSQKWDYLRSKLLLFPSSTVEITPDKQESWYNDMSEAVIDGVTVEHLQAKVAPSSKEIALPIDEVMLGGGHQGKVTMQKLMLCDKIGILGVSAEPFFEYEQIVANYFEGCKMICCGYINTVFGYLPTDKEFKKGGYEVDEWTEYYALKGKLTSALQYFFMKGLKKLS